MSSIEEQSRCRDWLAEHGHDHPLAHGARQGATDWLMEEVLEMLLKEVIPDNPLKGIEITRWVSDVEELKRFLRAFINKGAIVCVSPNRTQRCDQPATGIFFQDELEWYPCCDAHWPSFSQWTGNSRMRGGIYVAVNLFLSRISDSDILESDKVERYDREEAC